MQTAKYYGTSSWRGDKTMRVVRRAKSKIPYLNLHERAGPRQSQNFLSRFHHSSSFHSNDSLAQNCIFVDYAGSADYSAKISRMTTKTALERSPMAAHWRRSERGKFRLTHRPMQAKYKFHKKPQTTNEKPSQALFRTYFP